MIDRKAALVGCRHGQWVRTKGMRGLKLNAKARPEVKLRVAQLSGDSIVELFFGAGLHELPPSRWTRVEVIEGPHADVLCLLETS